MRSLWTGSIGFGLVNIPVKLYSATQESDLDLDMLDKHDHSNIKFKRVNASTGKEVPYANIVRAYNLNGKYVVLSDEDFQAANAKKTKTVSIQDFVNEEEIDSTYYETPYYLEPDKGGTRAYALLREALKKTKKVGVATFVLRNKEHLAVLKPVGNVIVLERLRFAEEIRDEKELKLPAKSEVSPKELEMAVSLINHQKTKFDIAKYKDTYAADLMKMIKAKSKGAKIPVQKLKVVHKSSGDDLMSQLKASLSEKKKKAS